MTELKVAGTALRGALVLMVAVAAGCTSSGAGGGTPPSSPAARPSSPVLEMPRAVGAGEGKLELVARAGYAENGSSDRSVDWVTPFTESTGCQVTVKVAATPGETAELLRTGRYDGASVSADATAGLVDSGDVAPVNTGLVPNYRTVSGFLKNRPWNSFDRKTYGIPHGWAANLLVSRPDILVPAPDSWSAVFDPESPYKGRITAYDSPIYIADAALYLKSAQPELNITDPYELDQTQFAAAVGLLEQQRALVGEYWSDYTDEVRAFESGDAVVGTAWQVIADLINGDRRTKVDAIVPVEGATGWSDTWMVSSRAKNPNCMYKWLDWIISPTVNARAAEWFGQAPAQTRSCAQTTDRDFCETYHATDEAYARKISFWKTPAADCGDARGAVCKDYAAWAKAWADIRN